MKNDSVMFWVSVLLGAVLFFGFLYPSYVTNQVIKELRMEYTPGPYSPGFDPDKVNPSLFTDQKETKLDDVED